MINFLSSWIKNLSLALIVVSILEMILPNGKTKKYVKMVMGLYILFSIISPFINQKDKINLEEIDYDFYKKTYEQEVSSSNANKNMDIRLNQIYKKQLEKDITNKLEKKGYVIESCKVTANVNQNGNGIEKIVIKVKEKNKEGNDEENYNATDFENKIVTEIEKIQKVRIGNNEEIDDNEKNRTSYITKTDINIIKKFLIEEYEVNEECLRIS